MYFQFGETQEYENFADNINSKDIAFCDMIFIETATRFLQ